ncbi:MAG: 50S ribosomal protein L18 [Campylobacterales bacterium]
MRDKLHIKKNALRAKRKLRVRGKIKGSETLPRLSVFRSNKHLYAQAINDVDGVTLAAVDGSKAKLGNSKDDAKKLAEKLAGILKEKKIEEVVFDRNGYIYHGVIATFADSLREAGIRF